ncbi:PREDICTED: uncharacterized protein LOC104821164 [Tarenaya hassleriana]|uniref:uncharacterized protein LOC104821164 n=1 Tax=Tarenaya hassleriana TaxID=28532 RepID=UPI00053C41D0|nr:PREDICTED: uncharacterized protein LOC104821164 [Tarenaya hassleriana]
MASALVVAPASASAHDQTTAVKSEEAGSSKKREKKRTPLAVQRERTGRLTLKDIGKYFHLPVEEAARIMKVCPTVVKKICRRGGLARWPHRKKTADKEHREEDFEVEECRPRIQRKGLVLNLRSRFLRMRSKRFVPKLSETLIYRDCDPCDPGPNPVEISSEGIATSRVETVFSSPCNLPTRFL